MSEMETMFMQIFERKKRIIDQVKQRTLLFDQHLASKCLLEGIAPPPWLLSSSSSDELNKEELISGLLVPRVPQGIPYLSSYNKPIVTASKGDLPAGLHPSNKGIDTAGDRLSVSLQFPVNDAGGVSSCVQKRDSSAPAASPQDQRDARISNVYPKPAQSFEKIQRSKLDLPGSVYAEVRSSNKAVDAARDRLSVSPQFPVIDAGGASSCAQKRDSSIPASSSQDQRDARISNVYPEPAQSLEKIQRPKSDLPSSFSAGVHPPNKAVDAARDWLSVSPQFPVIDAPPTSSCVQKRDSCIPASSPRAQRDARISGVYPEPPQPLEKIQRFKSDLPSSFSAGVYPSNKAVGEVRDRLSVSPQFPVIDTGGASSCVQKPDSSSVAASPQDQRDARISNVSPKAVQSLDNFQRSTSELPGSFYSEVQTSNKAVDAAKDQLSLSPEFPVIDAGGASSCVQKPDSSSAASPQGQRDGRMSEVSPEPAKSLAKIQRSRSRQRALELRHSAKSVKSHSHDENKTKNNTCDRNKTENETVVFASGITGFEIAPVQNDNVRELELIESVDINDENCEVEEAKVGDYRSKEKELSKEKLISGLLFPSPQPANSYSSDDNVPNYKPAILYENEELPDGLFTEVHASSNKGLLVAGQSDLHQFLVSDAGCASNVVLELDSSVISPQSERKTRESDIDLGPLQSLARVQRSKSRQRALELRDSAKAAKNFCSEKNVSVYSSVNTGSQMATVQAHQVQESEMVKTVDFEKESSKVEEAQVSCFQSKEKSSNIYSGRITRSRSSGQQSSSIKEFSHVGRPTYIGRSSRSNNDIGTAKSSEQQIEENSPLSGKVGGRLTNTLSGSLSLKVKPLQYIYPFFQY
ncbi:hypothetical protein Pint_03850 [Pistacia integerrima]|uniref:Uncharacterized protein n=1 Tax=Pistacia integerrima TaxID=434235 RepID=A0ACC0Z9Y8_9ROSI|nr:hypothetical protein Pint_03850 [Pistacia integerrima]